MGSSELDCSTSCINLSSDWFCLIFLRRVVYQRLEPLLPHRLNHQFRQEYLLLDISLQTATQPSRRGLDQMMFLCSDQFDSTDRSHFFPDQMGNITGCYFMALPVGIHRLNVCFHCVNERILHLRNRGSVDPYLRIIKTDFLSIDF